MPLYFFDVDGIADELGAQFLTTDDARREACRALPQLAADQPTTMIGQMSGRTCIIRDADKVPLIRVSLLLYVEDATSNKTGARIFDPI